MEAIENTAHQFMIDPAYQRVTELVTTKFIKINFWHNFLFTI